jgi:hypothetical protein
MKNLILVFAVLITTVTCYAQKGFVLGHGHSGIGFGNLETHHGIRFTAVDSAVVRTNGAEFAILSHARTANGFILSLVNLDQRQNGIVLSFVSAEQERVNGLSLSAFAIADVQKLNGVGMGGFFVCGDTLNGFFFSPFFISYADQRRIGQINGFTLGGLCGASAYEVNGVCVSLFSNDADVLNGVSVALKNHARELHGIQIGLWNVAENNRIFKIMPLINMNFSKKLVPIE